MEPGNAALQFRRLQGRQAALCGGGGEEALAGAWEFQTPSAFARGQHDAAAEALYAARGDAQRFGGSHAQRDFIDQALLAACALGTRRDIVRVLLNERLMGTENGAFVITRGDGSRIYDDAGNEYLDATAGLWFTTVGHGWTEIIDAVARQLSSVAHYSNFGDYANDSLIELAERVAAMAPMPGSKVMFTSGGSEAVDSAVKLARRYWTEMGQPHKRIVISRTKAYHGMHIGATAIAGIPLNREGYDPDFVTDTERIDWDDAKALLGLIERVGAENIAAFIVEPIIGAGGVYLPPDGYLREVREICRDHDVLFIADEVVTGYGRIGHGHWFASSRFELAPDIITSAKGLTSGYVPMGAMIATPPLAEPFFAGGT